MHWDLGFAALAFSLSRLRLFSGTDRRRRHEVANVAFSVDGAVLGCAAFVLLVVFIGVHYVAAKLKWVAVDRSALGERISACASVAAGLIATFALGGMAPLIG